MRQSEEKKKKKSECLSFVLFFFFRLFFFLNLLFLNPSYGKQHDTFKGMQNNIQSTLIKLNEKIIIIFLEPGKYVSKWMSCFRFFFSFTRFV